MKITKYIFPALALALIVLFAVAYASGKQLSDINQAEQESIIATPEATGDVDESVDAIVTFSENETVVLGDEDEESVQAGSDTSDFDRYLNVYNENEI